MQLRDTPRIGFFKLSFTFLKAMYRWFRESCPTVSDAKFDKRLAACSSCQFLGTKKYGRFTRYAFRVFGIPLNYCKWCGCFVYLKAKLETEKCGNVTFGTGEDFWDDKSRSS